MGLRGRKTYDTLVEHKRCGMVRTHVMPLGQFRLDENEIMKKDHEWLTKFSFTKIILPALDAQSIFIYVVKNS